MFDPAAVRRRQRLALVVVPLIAGSVVFDGSRRSGRPRSGSRSPGVDPFAFVAVTTTRIVFPTSAATSVYVLAVAPLIAAQFAPALSQRCH